MVKIKKYVAGKDKIAALTPGTEVMFKNGTIAKVVEDRKLGSKGVLRKRFQIVSSGSGKKKASAKKPKKSAKKPAKKSAKKSAKKPKKAKK